MICKSDIVSIKEDIEERVGQQVIVRGTLGRSKSFEKEATLEKTYSNIFIVRYNDNNRNATYSYTDVLTKSVQLDIFDGERFSPLPLPSISEEKAM